MKRQDVTESERYLDYQREKDAYDQAVLERDYAPGTFGCHEALDRCSMLAGLVDELASHSAITLQPEWKAKADAAVKLLADLYQDIGRLHLSETKTTQMEAG